MAITHGTPSAYGSGCHCNACTDAHTKRINRQQDARQGTEPPVHGASGYRNYGCHCVICLAGHRALTRARRTTDGVKVNAGKEWIERDLARVLERKDDRRYAHTARELAVMLGRSVGAVNQQRHAARLNTLAESAARPEMNQD